MAEFKLETREFFGRIFVAFDRINKEIAARCNLKKKDDLEVLLPCEIRELFSKKIDYKRFETIQNQRRKIFVICKKGKKCDIFAGKDAQGIVNLVVLKHLEKNLSGNILIGSIANRGFVSGKAVLVPYITDLESPDFIKASKMFKEGDILVSKNTTPEIVVLIKKAGAIITEEGGITCHGAIVSREFNKPCIVGVKGILDVIKTGDFLEVDADNGIIKMLNL